MTLEKSAQLESRLSAFIDGEVREEEQHDVDALLVNDPQARALHEALKRGADFGRHAFDEMLKEPVPLDLVRTIKTAPQPRRAIRLPQPAHLSFLSAPSRGQVFALGLLLFLVGGTLGYMLGARPDISASQEIGTASDNRDWLEDIISAQRLYGRQNKRLAEIPADQPADILDWLTTNTGVTFRIPDLAGNGLTFQGARLLSVAGLPAGQLLYRSDDGDAIAIVFTKARRSINPAAETIRDDISVVSWSTALANYAVVGPSSDPMLDEIAAKAAGLI